MKEDRGGLERRLLQFKRALIVGTVTTDGERDYVRKLLAEAALAIGEARRVLEAFRAYEDETALSDESPKVCLCSFCQAAAGALAKLKGRD